MRWRTKALNALFVATAVALLFVTQAEGFRRKMPAAEEMFRRNINLQAGEEVIERPGKVQHIPLSKKQKGKSLIVDYSPYLDFYFAQFGGSRAKVFTLKVTEKKPAGTVAASELKKAPPVRKPVRDMWLRGYCWFNREYRISVEQFIKVPCVLTAISPPAVRGRPFRGLLRAKLTPNYSAEVLVFTPVELEVTDGSIWKVEGITWYDARTGSVNVADKVNRKLLLKAVASAASAGATEFAKGYEELYKARSLRKIYTKEGDLIEVKKSVPAAYPAMKATTGAVSAFVSGLVKLFQSDWKRVPAVFVIEKGKKLFVDLKAHRLD